MPTLHFTRWQTILPADETPTPIPGRTTLRPGDLDERERAQLVASVGRGSDLRFTVDDLFAPGFAARGGDCAWLADALEVPFEWWDVVDDAGVLRFQAWLYAADCGLVFAAGTTKVCAQAIQFGSAWEIEGDWENDEATRRAFGRAHQEAATAFPESSLAQFYVLDE